MAANEGDTITCRVRSLRLGHTLRGTVDMSVRIIQVPRRANASKLMEDFFDKLKGSFNIEIPEIRAAFGLTYVDKNNERLWLDGSKPLRKQPRGGPYLYELHVRKYPTAVTDELPDDVIYCIAIQLLEDLNSKRLPCSDDILAILCGFFLQRIFGDYDRTIHQRGYHNKFFPSITDELMVDKIIELHKECRTLSPIVCQVKILTICMKLEHYGKDVAHVSYLKAMNDGHVYLTTKKLVIMGPPCTGKTAFKHLLFNWPAPVSHHSTPIASRPIRAMERVREMKEGKIWDVVNPKDVYSMLADAIKAKDEKTDQQAALFEDIEDTPLESVDDKSVQSTSNDSNDPVATSHSESSSQHLTQSCTGLDNTTKNGAEQLDLSSNLRQESDDSTSTLDHSIEIIKQLKEIKNETSDLHQATWVHVLDSGGQPQFADTLRAFLRGNAVNIITIKLTEKLSDKPRFTYSLNGKVMNAPSELQMTNMQLIEHFVRSVGASKGTTIKIGDEKIITKPFFIIIGTHYDQATSGVFSKKEITEETIADKNRQLLTALGEFREHFIFYNKSSDELIFPVDNLCRRNRTKISAQIRERIMTQEGVGFKVPIPISWYMFELQMKEKVSQDNHGIISLQSCYDIGSKLKMKNQDVRACLVYFDTLTLCLYYKTVLPNVIFTNPQYLLDIISSIVSTSFITPLEQVLPKGQSLSPDAQKMLFENGVFEESLLDILGLPFVSSLFTKTDFLRLLQHISVAVRINSPDPVRRYFMPAVLSTDQLTSEQKLVFRSSIEPLVITFNSKVILQGLFPTLVVSLLSRVDKPHFFLDSRSKNFPRQLRHAIKLYSEDLFGSVFLCDEYSYIEVYFTGPTKNCYHLRQAILQAISTGITTLGYDEDTVEFSALVRCNRYHILPANNETPHPITISYQTNPPMIGCSVEDLPVAELTDEKQKCWLATEPITTAGVQSSVDISDQLSKLRPDERLPNDEKHVSLVVSVVKEVNEWEELGIFLGIRLIVINEIKKNNFFQVATSRMNMIKTWLQGGTATCQSLKLALKRMGRNDIIYKQLSSTGNIDCLLTFLLPEGILNEDHAPLILSAIKEVYEWEDLGLHLGIKWPVIEGIKKNNFEQITTSRINMIIVWIQGGNATNNGLISALREMGKNNIVHLLQKKT